MQKSYGVHFLFILAVCFFAFFVNNGAVNVNSPEARNLITAREMVEYQNWAAPTLNGEPRVNQPPLATWTAAIVEHLRPGHVVLQRTVSGALATVAVLFLYLLASALTRNRLFGLLSALVLATCFSMVMMGRTVEGYNHAYAFMLGAMYFFHRAASDTKTRWGDFILAGLLAGLAFLAKGLELFYTLLLPFLLAYIILYRPSFRHKRWPLALMVLACCLVASTWIALALRAGENISPFMDANTRPWYYYRYFFAESGIWSLFLLTGLCGWFHARQRVTFRAEYSLALLWLLLSLLLLTLFPGKSMRYLPSVLIPASLVVGHYVLDVFLRAREKRLERVDKLIFRLNAFLPAAISLAMPVALYIIFRDKLSLPLHVIFSALFLLVSFSIITGALKLKPLKVFTGMMVMMILTESFLLSHLAATFNNPEMHTIRLTRQDPELRGLPFYHPAGEVLRPELVYEAGRRILPLDLGASPGSCPLPAVLVSNLPADQVLPPSWLTHITLRSKGYYNNNAFRRPSPGLTCHVSLLEECGE